MLDLHIGPALVIKILVVKNSQYKIGYWFKFTASLEMKDSSINKKCQKALVQTSLNIAEKDITVKPNQAFTHRAAKMQRTEEENIVKNTK